MDLAETITAQCDPRLFLAGGGRARAFDLRVNPDDCKRE
jgi:hypothetical protein